MLFFIFLCSYFEYTNSYLKSCLKPQVFYKNINCNNYRTNLLSRMSLLEDLTIANDYKNDIIRKTEDIFKIIQDALQNKDNGITNLDLLLSNDCKWTNPVVSNKKEILESIQKVNTFFEDTSIVIYDMLEISNEKIQITYQLSFWYPLPWRPRVIIPSTAILTYSKDMKYILSFEENWEINLLEIFFNQMFPRFWDLWHVFSSPTPEYPPIKQLSRIDQIEIIELPATVHAQARWRGAAKYSGPPLLAVPGFSLIGDLKSSRPRREPYLTILPVEVQSYRYNCPKSGEEMKQSTWLFHVPTSLQNSILNKAKESKLEKLIPISLLPSSSINNSNSDDDLINDNHNNDDNDNNEKDDIDYQVGFENMNLMKSVTGGISRGNFTLNITKAIEFESKQEIDFHYRITSKRIIAAINLYGEIDNKKIANGLNNIKTIINKQNIKILNKTIKIKSNNINENLFNNNSDINDKNINQFLDNLTPLFGLQLYSVKTCFNKNAEPSMAIYEMQYSSRMTKLFVELSLE